MNDYVLRRMLVSLPTLLGASLLIFTVLRVMPGDVVLAILGQGDTSYSVTASEEDVRRLRQELHLDLPYHEQYLYWLRDLASANLGTSFYTKKPVIEEIARALPITLELALFTFVLSILIAVPLGVISAVRQDTWVDHVLRLLAVGGLSIPSFWMATLAILLPLLWFGWVPPLTYVPLLRDPGTNLIQFLIPALIQGVHGSATELRMTRSMVLEVLRQDYVRTAWAKGLRERQVVYRHVLRNAMIPVVTLLGQSWANLLGGLVIMEVIFGLPGVGRLMVDSIAVRDLPVVQALVLMFVAIFVLVNLAVDLLYGWLDPRISYQ